MKSDILKYKYKEITCLDMVDALNHIGARRSSVVEHMLMVYPLS